MGPNCRGASIVDRSVAAWSDAFGRPVPSSGASPTLSGIPV